MKPPTESFHNSGPEMQAPAQEDPYAALGNMQHMGIGEGAAAQPPPPMEAPMQEQMQQQLYREPTPAKMADV